MWPYEALVDLNITEKHNKGRAMSTERNEKDFNSILSANFASKSKQILLLCRIT